MIETGYITDVRIVTAGSALLGDHAAGVTVLQLEDASDFNDEGGSVTIGNAQYAYSTVDFDNDILTLTSGLNALALDADRVLVFPTVTEKVASVQLENSEEAISVRIPHNLSDLVPEGVRDDDGEAVEVELVNFDWVIRDVMGKTPTMDGSYIDTNTLPSSDGVAPQFSPAPSVSGSIGALFVRWTGLDNADPVSYEVHVSTSTTFTPDSTTLHSTHKGNTAVIKELPNGSAMTYGTTYYIRLVAYDADGSAPASTIASGQMVQATGPDIAANYIYGGSVSANQLTSGTLNSDIILGSTIKTADAGARVELGTDGIEVYDSSGTPTTVLGSNGESTFKGTVEASGLTVTGPMSLRSNANEISTGGVLRMATAVTASSIAPTVVTDWASLTLKTSTGANWPSPANLSGLVRTPDGNWLAADTASPKLHRWDATGTYLGVVTIPNIVKQAVQITSGGDYYGIRSSGGIKLGRLNETVQFSDSFSALTNWTTSGTTAIDTGRAALTAVTGTDATLTRTLASGIKDKSVAAKVTVGTSSIASMTVTLDSTNYWRVSATGTTLTIEESWTADSVVANVSYNASTQAYWRIAEHGGLIYVQSSSNGTSWTTVYEGSHLYTNTQLTSSMTWELRASLKGAVELSPNPGFETSLSGVGQDWPTTRITTQHHSGIAAAQITQNSTPDDNMVFAYQKTDGNPNVAAVGGKTYNLSAWVKPATSIRGAHIGVMWYSGPSFTNMLSVTEAANVIETSGAWKNITFTAKAPATAKYMRPFIMWTGAATGEAHYIDDFSIVESGTQATTATSFFDEAVQAVPAIEMTLDSFDLVNDGQVPALGVKGTSLLLAEVSGTGYYFTTVDPANLGTGTGRVTSNAVTGAAGPLAGVLNGNFDFGSERYVVVRDSVDGVNYLPFSVSGTAATYVAAEAFPAPSGGSKGFGWDGTVFTTLGTTGNLLSHTTATNGTTPTATWKAGFTWSDATAQESAVSPSATFTFKKRARTTVTSANLPPAGTNVPDRIRVFAGTSTLYYQATSAAGSNVVRLTAAMATTGAIAPTVTSWSASTPATIRSTNDELLISADGTAKIKGLIAYSAQDANTSAGNAPALKIGDTAGAHLRIDGNEIIAMASDSTVGLLFLPHFRARATMQSGTATITITTANTGFSLNVTFPTAFATVPVVVVSPNATTPNAQMAVAGITTTGFTAYAQRSTATNLLFSWWAHNDD